MARPRVTSPNVPSARGGIDRAGRGVRLFDLSLGEMLLIGVVILVFVGPDRIPELMSTAGKYYGKVRRMSDDLRRAFNAEVARAEADRRRDELEARRKAEAARRQERQAAAQAAAGAEAAPGEAEAAGADAAPSPPAPSGNDEPVEIERPSRTPLRDAAGRLPTSLDPELDASRADPAPDAPAPRPTRPQPEGAAGRPAFPQKRPAPPEAPEE